MKKVFLTLVSVLVMEMSMAQQGNHWSPISGTQYNMTVKGVIVIDGVQQSNNMLEIGAFCGDECRGSRKASLFPPTGDYIVTLAVVSNVVSGETITFRIYDHDAQQELDLESLSTLTFVDNSNVGDPTSWFPIAFAAPAFHFTTVGNWSETSNWQGGVLPGASDVVFIDANCTLNQDATVTSLTITDGAVLTLQSSSILIVTGELVSDDESKLVIKDGGQLINASDNVSATVEKDIAAYGASNPYGWYAIASPIDEMLIEGSAFLTEQFDLFRFNDGNVGNEWENYRAGHADFTTFENGRGYLYANTNSFSPTLRGVLSNTTVTYPMTCSNNATTMKGLNLIGNPFPHAIYKGDGGAIDNANLASGYYSISNGGAWVVHTYDDAIMPGQGVLVKTVAAGNLVISKSNAVATSESKDAKGESERMRISVIGNTGEDRAFVYFGQGIGLGKMGNFSETAPNLSVNYEGKRFAIAHVADEVESLDIFFRNSQQAVFTMNVESQGVRFDYLHLIDNVTGANVDLLQQPEYTFSATGNEYEARFKLMFKKTTSVDEETETHFCFVNGDQLMMAVDSESVQLSITDVLGRMVKSLTLEGDRCSLSGLKSGLYIVKMSDGNRTYVQKVVYNK